MRYLFYSYVLSVNPILIAAAVIPAVILLSRVYKADRLEHEPTGMLIGLVLLGIFSTGLALAAEELGTVVLDFLLPQGSLIYNLLMYFIVVAVSEEGFKYLLLKKRTWRSVNFDCQFDGIVYAVFVSLGFALWENIEYVIAFGGLETALVRAVTAIPGHAAFGVFMGFYYGLAKRAENQGFEIESRNYRKLAVRVPVLIHGAYDFIATMESGFSVIFFIVFILIVFMLANRLVKSVSQTDSYI